MEGRRLEMKLERQREKEKRQLCNTYPGGPEGYRYVPARCVRIPDEKQKKKSSRRHRPVEGEEGEGLGRFSRNTLRLLRRQHMELMNRLRDIGDRADNGNMNNIEDMTAEEGRIAVRLYHEMLTNMPVFILRCVEQMLSARLMHDYPSVHERYQHIAQSTDEGEMFENKEDVEWIILRLCLKRLEDMGILTHPSN